MNYGYKRKVNLTYADAVNKVTTELKKEGFGVLTSIDVKKTLKEKLGADFDDYIILGACNPPLAHEALTKERDIGLLLPCNVIVYSNPDGEVFISALVPTVAMSFVDNEELKETATIVESKLKRVINNV